MPTVVAIDSETHRVLARRQSLPALKGVKRLRHDPAGFLIAEFARINDKKVVMRIGDVRTEVAGDILLAVTVLPFDVFAASFSLSPK